MVSTRARVAIACGCGFVIENQCVVSAHVHAHMCVSVFVCIYVSTRVNVVVCRGQFKVSV